MIVSVGHWVTNKNQTKLLSDNIHYNDRQHKLPVIQSKSCWWWMLKAWLGKEHDKHHSIQLFYDKM